jgi:para-nitrobenzyl esterase
VSRRAIGGGIQLSQDGLTIPALPIRKTGEAKIKKLAIAVAIVAVVALLAIFRPWVPKAAADNGALRHPLAGDLVGFADKHDTYAWLGVPFAQPPVGPLRWRAPQPPASWQGTRQALALSPACMQLDSFAIFDKHAASGSEDCLYLNIWTPRVATDAAAQKPLPVMVWIHGGGNTMGFAEATPGNHLAGAEQVVVVTLQYRLGVFGWLSLPALRDKAATPADRSSNFGLLDLIAGLQWVHDNIAAFGGDPANVTVFGESSGAHDVMALLAAAPAKGLFQRAISESGSVHATPRSEAENYRDDTEAGLPESAREFVNGLLIADGAPDRIAAKAKQQTMDGPALLAYLRGKSPKQLLAAVKRDGFGMYDWPVVIRDGYILADRPMIETFADPAHYNVVPVMLGANRDESKLFMMGDPDLTGTRFGFIPKIKDLAAYNRITGYHSEKWRAEAVEEVAAVLHKSQGYTVFTYRFDWDDEPAYSLVNLHDLLGAAHSSEVNFIFGDDVTTGLPFVRSADNGAERDALSEAMMGYWANFARGGAPANGGKAANPAWQPWSESGPTMMTLNSPDHGGPKMSDTHERMADLKARLRADDALATPQARCKLYYELFHEGFSGGEYFDAAEYKSLACTDAAAPGN